MLPNISCVAFSITVEMVEPDNQNVAFSITVEMEEPDNQNWNNKQ